MLVQEIVEWTVEFRSFVLDRKLAAISAYWRDNKPAKSDDGLWTSNQSELKEATSFCEGVLADQSVSLPEVVALDVGIVRNRGWAVIECNAAFSSGIYGCDPLAVLPVLRHSCQPALSE